MPHGAAGTPHPGPGEIHRRSVESFAQVLEGRFEDALELIDPEVVDHRGGTQGDHRGREAWRQKWMSAGSGFHDVSVTIEQNVVSGDTSVNRYTVRGAPTPTPADATRSSAWTWSASATAESSSTGPCSTPTRCATSWACERTPAAGGRLVTATPGGNLARWQDAFDNLIGRVAGRFARVEPRRRMRKLVLGLLSDLPRKNCWTIAEWAGDTTPDGMQHLLGRAKWDADQVRDDLRAYVVEHLHDDQAVLVVDETAT